MSTTVASLAEKFASQEYMSFKETVERSSLDNKLVIKNKHVVYGKQKVKVPNFVNAKRLIEFLEGERVKHLLEYNDIYQKILVSDKPQIFKSSYDKLVTTIANIEVLIDEIHAFVESRSADKRADTVGSKLKDVIDKAHNTAQALQANGVLDVVKVKQLVALFHESLQLHSTHIEAKQEPLQDYVIYDLPTKENHKVVSTSRPSKRTGLTMLGKVKPNIKKLMIDKLEIST